jgi:hypothetical protein
MQLPIPPRAIFDHPYSPFARRQLHKAGDEHVRAMLANVRAEPEPILPASRDSLLVRAAELRDQRHFIRTHQPAIIGSRGGMVVSAFVATLAGAAHGATGSAWAPLAMGLAAGAGGLYADDADHRAAANIAATTIAAIGIYRVTRAAVEELRT